MTELEDFNEEIYVKSHVPRDLIQSADLFKNEKLVVWEYVSNGLEYIDEGTNPVVHVILDNKKKRIVIFDNGRGMDWDGLKNFFLMHGENIDRKAGRPGRGRFGTGKSAAFGIADILIVTTVKDGKRCKVKLTRRDIEEMNSESPIPVKILEKNEQTKQANGTMIEIEGIHLRSIKQADVIQYIERHIAKWKNATVFVNKRECEASEPSIVDKKIFQPDAKRREILGDVELIIKIAGAPLEEDDCGVSIYSNGVWYETTLAGNKGREMVHHIFGEIDVPRLDEDKSPIRAIDMSRSMRLNPNNELVLTIYGFIGESIDQVRRELLKEEKKRKESEDAKKLAEQAEEIAQVINEDFRDFRLKLAKARAKGSQGFDSGSSKIEKGTDPDDLIFGFDEPAEITGNSGDIGSGEGERVGGEEPRALNPPVSPASPEADKLGKARGGKGNRRSTSGGFRVEFKPMGEDSSRALYVGPERTIYINIEHPQLVAARGSKSVEDPVFLRLAFEVAFSEYCIALAHELDQRGEFIDTSDPIVTIRENINRISRKAAQLYA